MQVPLKRFYKDVAVASRDGVHQVTLDGRVLRSPAKADLHFPSAALAEAVAEEWAGQTERIDAASMPLMTLSSTAVDYVRPRRTAIVEELVGFGFSRPTVELVWRRLTTTHWKRELPTVAMLSSTAIGAFYLRPVDF